jgi:hypothetical protein
MLELGFGSILDSEPGSAVSITCGEKNMRSDNVLS